MMDAVFRRIAANQLAGRIVCVCFLARALQTCFLVPLLQWPQDCASRIPRFQTGSPKHFTAAVIL